MRLGISEACQVVIDVMNVICEPAAPVATGTATTTPNVSVWLVDDNDRFQTTLGELLGRMRGIQCARHFSSPDAMLSTLASQIGPDVILLDIQMRDRDGLAAIGPIKALSCTTQVLMLTTYFDSEWRDRAIAEGASDFLLKSYPPEEIVRRIRNPDRRVNARRRRSHKPACSGSPVREPVKSSGSSASVLK